MKWSKSRQIEVDMRNIKPKKITGTRFAAILGLNPWKTPFEAWCEITRTYEKPFTDNIYTTAGKIIEPKQAEYIKNNYMLNVITPADKYGADYFEKTRGDFFPDTPIFGGMWDYLTDNEVLEMKTTKRVEDWGDRIPEYYALQVALYGYLLKREDVALVCSFLEQGDYLFPNSFTPDDTNTVVELFNVNKEFQCFEERFIWRAVDFWNNFVLTGISPQYDEVRDKEILEALRTKEVNFSDDVLTEFDKLKASVDKQKEVIKADEKRLKELTEVIKNHSLDNMANDTDKVQIKSNKYVITTSKNVTQTIDKDKLVNDGLFDTYAKDSITYRTTVKEIK